MAAPGIAAVGTFTYEDAQGLTFHWDQLMSASLTISVPVIVAFLAPQRYFVRGLSSGALK